MMSKSKWFVVRKPSTGEMIATSANQIVPLKFCGGTKMLYYIHQTPFSLGVLKGVLGTRLHVFFFFQITPTTGLIVAYNLKFLYCTFPAHCGTQHRFQFSDCLL